MVLNITKRTYPDKQNIGITTEKMESINRNISITERNVIDKDEALVYEQLKRISVHRKDNSSESARAGRSIWRMDGDARRTRRNRRQRGLWYWVMRGAINGTKNYGKS